VPAIVSTIFYFLIYEIFDWEKIDEGSWFIHPYPMSMVLVVFTFLLTFKTSFSYNRYWEACTAIHQMHSKWLDVGMSIAGFHLQSNTFDAVKPPACGSFFHNTSIVQKREYTNMIEKSDLFDTILKSGSQSTSKIIQSSPSSKKRQNQESIFQDRKSFARISLKNYIPALCRKEDNKNEDCNDKIPHLFIKSHKYCTNSIYEGKHKVPSLFLQESVHLLSLLSAVAFSTLRNDIDSTETHLTTWEPGSPWPSADPDNKDFITNLRLYNLPHLFKIFNFMLGLSRSPAQRKLYNTCRPFMVLGGVSDSEITMLKIAHGPLAKTSLCTMWLQEFISRESIHGSLGQISPPIVSRLYQYTSDGMIGYNQARKISYIPFPFVHNQLTACYVLILLVFIPILMLSYVKVCSVGAVLNAFTVSIFAGKCNY